MSLAEPASTAHRLHPPETWALARDDYLTGLSAPVVCKRYGLGLSTFRERASREGWRRADQPQTVLTAAEQDEELELLPLHADLSLIAWRNMADAIRRRRVTEAEAWARLHTRLTTVELDEKNLRVCFPSATEPSAPESSATESTPPTAAQAPDDLDDLDGGAPRPDAPMNRAVRRRAQALARHGAANGTSISGGCSPAHGTG